MRGGRDCPHASGSRRAFSRTAAYDAAIAKYFAGTWKESDPFPENLVFGFDRVSACATGEPRTSAPRSMPFRERGRRPRAVPDAQGKELSFNNLLDLDSAVSWPGLTTVRRPSS